MHLQDFDFDLPERYIAKAPLSRRQDARLLVLDKRSGGVSHHRVADLPDLLDDRIHLVVNDSKVMPSSLRLPDPGAGGHKRVAFGRDPHSHRWRPLGAPSMVVDPLRGPANGQVEGNNGRLLADAEGLLKREGRVTFPRYLAHLRHDHRVGVPAFYDTVYARVPGSVAPPSGGLNLTPGLLTALARRGLSRSAITLHVGHVTFKRPLGEDLSGHRMEGEFYAIGTGSAQAMHTAKRRDKRLLAVGTSTTRALEHAALGGGLDPSGGVGIADLFIRPGHRFRLVDGLLTGLHGPKTTLLMLVCALAGRRAVLDAYEEAKGLGYRWYTLGDSMLII